MSCCSIKQLQPKNDELNKLKGLFDSVEVENLKKFRLLTLKDKSKNPSIDWVVWLQVRVSYSQNEKYFNKSDDDILSSVCKSIFNWVELLKNHNDLSSTKQLSLFEEEKEVELEKLPPSPASDSNWTMYFRSCEKINKNNLIKQYSFFELLDIEYYTYCGIDYRKELPSLSEARELLKKAITEGMVNPGRHDCFWLDTPSYISNNNEAMSDSELIVRLRSIRMFLVPYKTHKRVSIDNSFKASVYEAGVDYRYYLDGTELSSCAPQDNDKKILPSYKGIYDVETIQWVRDTLCIPIAMEW